MSTENRNKVLLGFGALVVVLIAAIALWPPNFRKEDASGAIGAVQKHRAPQITQKDVILGDESVRHEQKVLYADFLADAAKLRAIGTRDASAAQREIAAMRDEVMAHYTAEVAEILARAARGAQEAAMKAEVENLRAMAAAVKDLSAADLDRLDAKLSHLASEIQEDSLYARALEASRHLDAAIKDLNARPLEAAKELETAQMELDARPKYGVLLEDEVAFVAEARKELKALDNTEAMYAKRIADQEIAAALASAADELEAQAIRNIGADFELNVKTAEALSQLDHKVAEARKALGVEAQMESRKSDIAKNIGVVSAALASRDAEFKAHASAEVRGHLNALNVIIESRKPANAAALHRGLLEMQKELEAAAPLGRMIANEELSNEVRSLQAKAQD